MKKLRKISTLGTLVSLFAAQSVFAHPGHDFASGAMAGLMHPLTGIDHLIALICVGALFALAPARVRWTGVVAMLASLWAGASVGLAGIALPASESMIALSVLVAGVMLVRSGSTKPALLIAGSVIFSLFHGYAHGVESSADAAAFVTGFIVTSFAVVTLSMRAVGALLQPKLLLRGLGTGSGIVGIALLAALAI